MKGNKPKRLVTGLHTKIHVFGFLSENKKKMFLMHDKINTDKMLFCLYKMRRKFKKFILVLDSAPWHKKSKKVRKYFSEHKASIKVIYFPKGCPDMNPVEECWRQSKKEVNGGRIHENFETMKKELKSFFRKTNFKQDVRKYLRP